MSNSLRIISQTKEKIVHWINHNHPTHVKIGQSCELCPTSRVSGSEIFSSLFGSEDTILVSQISMLLICAYREPPSTYSHWTAHIKIVSNKPFLLNAWGSAFCSWVIQHRMQNLVWEWAPNPPSLWAAGVSHMIPSKITRIRQPSEQVGVGSTIPSFQSCKRSFTNMQR